MSGVTRAMLYSQLRIEDEGRSHSKDKSSNTEGEPEHRAPVGPDQHRSSGSEAIVTMRELRPPRVLGDKVWCPRCVEYVKVVRVSSAAKIVDVDRRTIYNYVKKNKVFAVKVAGSTLRVCTHCLLRENDEQADASRYELSLPAKSAV